MKLTALILAVFALAIAALHATDPAPVATVTITLQLTQEEVAALTAHTAAWNGAEGKSTVQERILADAITPWIKQRTAEAYALAMQRLGEAAKGLSYAERTALIQQVQAAIKAK